jgi:hypothetical protein
VGSCLVSSTPPTIALAALLELPAGEFALDPDEQVQAVVRMVFEQFEWLGTVRKVLHYFLANGIRLGIRARTGPNRGQLEWRTPILRTLTGIRRHPIYAGYYCYGRRRVDLQIIRFLVERLDVDMGAGDDAWVMLTWVGGQTSEHEVVRPVMRYEQTAGLQRLLARIKELLRKGCCCPTSPTG